ncbi:MAG: hypothetical protein AAF747_05240 [Planctomycetota bacterium]
MAATTSGYTIGRRTGLCAATGQPLEPGEAIEVVLAEHPERDELDRLEFGVEAWDGGARPEPPLAVFAHWHSVAPEPNAKPRLLVEDAELMDVFEQLAEATERKRLVFRYLLALILMRRKALVLEGIQRGDPERLLVRPRGTDKESPAIEVVDPGMDDEAIAEGIEALSAVISPGAVS